MVRGPSSAVLTACAQIQLCYEKLTNKSHGKLHSNEHLRNHYTYTLVELSVASQCHPGLVSTIHSVNVVSFDLLNLIHCYVASKGYLRTGREEYQSRTIRMESGQSHPLSPGPIAKVSVSNIEKLEGIGPLGKANTKKVFI